MIRCHTPVRALLRLLAAVALAGCVNSAGPVVPTQLTIVGAAELAAVAGTEVPLAVRVDNVFGDPLAGAVVTFQVSAGGGTLTAATAVTDAAGVARTGWRLGTQAGVVQRAEAAATGVRGPLTVAFTASATADVPAAVEWEGDFVPNPSPLGATLGSYTVLVLDRFGNRVRGAPVTLTTRGGGSATPATGVTNVDGAASTTWTLGLRDTVQTLRAASGSLGSPELRVNSVTYHDAIVEVLSGDGQTGTVGQPLAQPVVVRVRLPDGRPVEGALLQGATAHGGTVTPFRSRTAANGTTSLQWTLGPHPGTQQLQAHLIVNEHTQTVRFVNATAQP